MKCIDCNFQGKKVDENRKLRSMEGAKVGLLASTVKGFKDFDTSFC